MHLLMDRAYEGNETRQLALDLGFIPVVPPLKTRIEPWEYDREMYKRRNAVERLFRRGSNQGRNVTTASAHRMRALRAIALPPKVLNLESSSK